MASRTSGIFATLRKNINVGFSFGVGDIRQFANAIANVGKQAEELVNVSDRLGITTKQLQELHHAAEETDVGVEGMNDALDQFAKRIGDAASGTGELKGILEANGIALRDQNGNMRPLLDLFGDYIDLMQRSQDATQRADLATAAFGRGTKEMINLASEGRAGLQRYADAANRLGIVLEDQMVRKMADVNDEWELFSRVIGTEFRSTVMQIVTGFSEGAGGVATFQTAIQGLFQFIRDNLHWLDNLVGALAGLRLGSAFGPAGAAIGAGLGALAPELIPSLVGGARAPAVTRANATALADMDKQAAEYKRLLQQQEDTLEFSNAKIRELELTRAERISALAAAGQMTAGDDVVDQLTADMTKFEVEAKSAEEGIVELTSKIDVLTRSMAAVPAAAAAASTALANLVPGGELVPGESPTGTPAAATPAVPAAAPAAPAAPTRPAVSAAPLAAYRAGTANLDRFNSDFEASLATMFADAPEAIRAQTRIISGFRTFEHQARLYADALKKYGSPAGARGHVAPPGKSEHEVGNAADFSFGSTEAREWFRANASKYGLRFPFARGHEHIQGVAGAAQRQDDNFRATYEANARTQEQLAADRARAVAEQIAGELQLKESVEGVFEANQRNIQAIKDEATALGLSGVEREKFIITKQIENELYALGIKNLEEYRKRIDEGAEGLALATVKLEEFNAANQNMEQVLADAEQFTFGALKGFVSDLIAGKSAAEALGGVLQKIGDQLIDMALRNLVGNLFSGLGTGGGAAGGLLGFMFGGGRARGGPVTAGSGYMVGERGPEIFVPQVSGRIQANGAGGGAVAVQIGLNDGMLNARIVRTSGPVAARISHGAISETQDRQKRQG